MNKGMVIAPVGASGSGKSRLRAELSKEYPDMKVVCPDDIRREKFGTVNDTEHGAQVFMIANLMTKRAIEKGQMVFFDATNLGKALTALKKEYYVIPIFLKDSYDVELCISRVKKDIADGKDRSNVPEEVVRKQHQKFIAMDIDSLNGVLYDGDIKDVLARVEFELNYDPHITNDLQGSVPVNLTV
jgi:predicted kinase